MEYINAIKYQPTGINGTLLKNQKSKEENKVMLYNSVPITPND